MQECKTVSGCSQQWVIFFSHNTFYRLNARWCSTRKTSRFSSNTPLLSTDCPCGLENAIEQLMKADKHSLLVITFPHLKHFPPICGRSQFFVLLSLFLEASSAFTDFLKHLCNVESVSEINTSCYVVVKCQHCFSISRFCVIGKLVFISLFWLVL